MRGDGAHGIGLLAPIHAAFSEGLDTVDLVLARELLVTLAL